MAANKWTAVQVSMLARLLAAGMAAAESGRLEEAEAVELAVAVDDVRKNQASPAVISTQS